MHAPRAHAQGGGQRDLHGRGDAPEQAALQALLWRRQAGARHDLLLRDAEEALALAHIRCVTWGGEGVRALSEHVYI